MSCHAKLTAERIAAGLIPVVAWLHRDEIEEMADWPESRNNPSAASATASLSLGCAEALALGVDR